MLTNSLEKWIDRRQSSGKYWFTRAMANTESGLSAEAVMKSLQRLVVRHRVTKINDTFFAIVPLEYVSSGAPPAAWLIDELMRVLDRPYYVGLLTAAGLHGASHQQPQEFQVMTDRPIRSANAGRTRLRFFQSKFVELMPVERRKTPTGQMKISTPESTAVDLIRMSRSAGYLDHVATVISELSQTLNPDKLLGAVQIIDDIPIAQRLGFVLDLTSGTRLTKPLKKWIDTRSPKLIPLRSSHRTRDGVVDRRWKVLVDQPLEIEA